MTDPRNDGRKRVVITGIGVVSPLGCTPVDVWEALRNGTSGISKIESIPTDSLPVSHGGEAKAFTGKIADFGDLDKAIQRSIRKNQKVMCREIELGVAACQKALADCGLSADDRDPIRTGIVYGCDYILTRPEEYADGIASCLAGSDESVSDSWPNLGLKKVNPLWLLKYLPNMPASHVAIYNDLRGPSNSLTVREASNNLSLIEATEIIRRGAADVMIAGATGSTIHPLRTIHIARQFKLASDRDAPSEMARPFAEGRDGIVLGEGAGAMVLESFESAKARGAKIYGEVISGASTSVAAGSSPAAVQQATANMLTMLKRSSSDYFSSPMHIHASGRSELDNDRSEAAGIAEVLGDVSTQPPTVAAKSYFGSLGAGGAAVEVISSCLALNEGRLFKTLNSQDQSADCPIRLTGNAAAEDEPAGQSFVHLSYTPQGQASAILIAKVD
jgi:3-oxoacyl-[acyl-carrier-protein] synthase II